MDKKTKILVIEDDITLNKIYQTKLGVMGYEVAPAYNGEEAVAKAKSEMPDLILLDLMLPKKSGFDVLTEIKADESTKDIPVIILSNLGQEEDVKRGLEMGAIDFLTKSNIKLVDVVKKIQDILIKYKVQS